MNYMERYACGWSSDSLRLIATPSATARASFFYVQETGYFKTLPDYFTERSHLNSYLIVFTLSGRGYLEYRGKNHTLLPQQVFFIDCMDHHYYRTDRENLWEMLWVHFNGSTSRGYFEQFARAGSPVATVAEESPIPDILRQIVDIQKKKDIRTEILSSKLLVELLTELLLASSVNPSGGLIPQYIQAVAGELDRRFNEKITLDELAEKFAVSKFYLSREFKKYIGITPNEYLIGTRINYAKELLKYSAKPVAEIAELSGIDNTSHFIRLFRDRTGVTPLSFRNKWNNPK